MRPIILSWRDYDLHSAPVFAGLAVLAAYLYFRSRNKELGLSLDDFWTLMLSLMLGLFLGGVLVYASCYGPGLAHNLGALRRGAVAGGSFLGVFWGAAAAAYIFCRIRGLAFAPIADALGAAASLGLVPMRMGCLLNGCCYGRPTRLAWGIVFRDVHSAVARDLRGVALHPSQIYEGLGALVIFLFLHLGMLPRTRNGRARPGAAFLLFIALYASLRFALDFLRGSDPGNITGAGLSTAQLFSLLSLGVVAAAWALRRKSA